MVDIGRFFPDWVIQLLDDLGDWAEDQAEKRGLIEVESDYQWSIRQMSDRFNSMSDIEKSLFLEQISKESTDFISQALENGR